MYSKPNISGANDTLMNYSFAEKCRLEQKIDTRNHSDIEGFSGSIKMIGTIYLGEQCLFN